MDAPATGARSSRASTTTIENHDHDDSDSDDGITREPEQVDVNPKPNPKLAGAYLPQLQQRHAAHVRTGSAGVRTWT